MLSRTNWLRHSISIVARAAVVPLIADSIISIAAGRVTIRTFPIVFPIVLIAILFTEWWQGRKSRRDSR